LQKRVRDGGGASDDLEAEDGILVDVRGGRELGRDARPVGVHLVRQNHRQRGGDSLAELDAIHDDHDPAIGHDVNESSWREAWCRP
jgi:hypothetical protein